MAAAVVGVASEVVADGDGVDGFLSGVEVDCCGEDQFVGWAFEVVGVEDLGEVVEVAGVGECGAEDGAFGCPDGVWSIVGWWGLESVEVRWLWWFGWGWHGHHSPPLAHRQMAVSSGEGGAGHDASPPKSRTPWERRRAAISQ